MMRENDEERACERAEDLVAYLYGEASEHEAREFQSHMEHCPACLDEFSAFRRVHEDVVEWRNRSLPFFESSRAVAPVFSAASEAERGRSALAALREFFKLSPMWMRAATAAAALVVCALLVFAVTRFYRQPETVVKVVQTGPTEAEVKEMVTRRAEELLRNEKQEIKPSTPQPQAVARQKDVAKPVSRKTPGAAISTVASAKQQKNVLTPGKASSSQAARQQLAELMQRTKEDDGIPRLSDLLEDSNESY
jgi:anti-sigma factor RsiW